MPVKTNHSWARRFARVATGLVLAFAPRPGWCSPEAQQALPRSTMQRLRGEAELSGFLATPFEGGDGQLGIGWRAALGVGWDRLPFTVGLDFEGAYFGTSSSRDVILIDGQRLVVDQQRSDSALFLDVFARLQPLWPVRPYLEGAVGPKRLHREYELSFPGEAFAPETTSADDWTYTLGLGLGLDVPLGGSLWLTGGVRRLFGGRVSYERALVATGGGVIRYDASTTTTTFSLGLIVR